MTISFNVKQASLAWFLAAAALRLNNIDPGALKVSGFVTARSAWRTELKLNSIFSRQFDQKRQFRLSFFEFFSASRKETIKTARHAHHDHREAGVPQHSWRMGNSFGKIDYVTPSATEQHSAEIYLDFTGFNEKCFIGGAMKVRRRNVGGRSGNPQHAKGATRLFRTYQNMGFLPKRPYNTAVVDSDGVGCNILNHGLGASCLATEFLLGLLSGPSVF